MLVSDDADEIYGVDGEHVKGGVAGSCQAHRLFGEYTVHKCMGKHELQRTVHEWSAGYIVCVNCSKNSAVLV